ncbi:MAG: apolipoprotein N-acyltransferase [Bacteroidetes bacterium]|nr:apolipoprotein N-acyltransferase [Bacteroidota bacterium]
MRQKVNLWLYWKDSVLVRTLNQNPMKIHSIPSWLLMLLPGIFFWLGWPPMPVVFTLFIAFVPLLELSERKLRGWKYFLYLYTSLFLWNLFTTWWVWNSSLAGAMVMLFCNSLFMTIPWLLYRRSKPFLGESSTYLFVILWLVFEYFIHRWDLSWPWLTLGNGLAGAPWLIQWYDITGTLGGTAFILAINVLIWKALRFKKRLYYFAAPALFLFVLLSSWFNIWKFRNHGPVPVGSLNTVVLQPSFDPWHEKFARDPMDLLQEMLRISAKKTDSSTQLLVWPETSLVDAIDVQSTDNDYQLHALRGFRKKYPDLEILTGADMQQIYRNVSKRPGNTSRPTQDPSVWYDFYNSALYVNRLDKVSFYHKSILVPGTEKMPFTEYFPVLNDWAIALDENSSTGSLGTSPEPKNLGPEKHPVAAAVCYESIYGDYLGKFIKKGAQSIAIITNDAWWGNTPGYKQHLAYATLRAIEQRRWIVRSANTGTSCFIQPDGYIIKATKWFDKTAIQHTISLYDNKTLYCRMGDGVILLILCGICCGLGTVLYWKNSTVKQN